MTNSLWLPKIGTKKNTILLNHLGEARCLARGVIILCPIKSKVLAAAKVNGFILYDINIIDGFPIH